MVTVWVRTPPGAPLREQDIDELAPLVVARDVPVDDLALDASND